MPSFRTHCSLSDPHGRVCCEELDVDLVSVVVGLVRPCLPAIDGLLGVLLRRFNRQGLVLNVVDRCLSNENSSSSLSLGCKLHDHIIGIDVVLRLALPALAFIPRLVHAEAAGFCICNFHLLALIWICKLKVTLPTVLLYAHPKVLPFLPPPCVEQPLHRRLKLVLQDNGEHLT